MRVEVRVEKDDHETAVVIECDQSVELEHAVDVAAGALTCVVRGRGIPSMPDCWEQNQADGAALVANSTP